MATYLITYDDGTDQKITADSFTYDGDQYIARTNGEPTGYIRPLDVRSIIRTDEVLTRETPRGPQPAKRASRDSGEVNT